MEAQVKSQRRIKKNINFFLSYIYISYFLCVSVYPVEKGNNINTFGGTKWRHSWRHSKNAVPPKNQLIWSKKMLIALASLKIRFVPVKF